MIGLRIRKNMNDWTDRYEHSGANVGRTEVIKKIMRDREINPAATDATTMFMVNSKVATPPKKRKSDEIINNGSQSTIVLRCQS